MGSLEELGGILKGAEAPRAPAGADAHAAALSALNQLSAAAAAEATGAAAPPAAAPAHTPAVAQPASQAPDMSQDLIDAHQPHHFQQPSQADIPPPVIPESQGAGSQLPAGAVAGVAGAGPEVTAALLASSAAAAGMDPAALTSMLTAPGMAGYSLEQIVAMGNAQSLAWAGMGGYGAGLGLDAPDDGAPAPGPRLSKGKKQTRRGPMDEMRQLIRILVKVMPQSVALVSNTDEQGGGNRISEEQIKSYLDRALGDAPRPAWGVPAGWHVYLAELFSWAVGRVVTPDEARRAAKREPGRSWEALEGEMHAMGVHPAAWPLPLSLTGVAAAEKNPVPQPVPAGPAAGPGGGGGADGAGAPAAAPPPAPKPKRAAVSEREFQRMDEADVWRLACDALAVAATKAGTSAAPGDVATLKGIARERLDAAAGPFAGFYAAMPMMAGAQNADFLAMLQQYGAAGAGGVGDADGGAAAQAAAMAAAAAQAAAAAAAMAPPPAEAPPAKRARGEEGGGEGDAARPPQRAPMSSAEARGGLLGALQGGGGGAQAFFPPAAAAGAALPAVALGAAAPPAQ
jgi:hypothetical protein